MVAPATPQAMQLALNYSFSIFNLKLTNGKNLAGKNPAKSPLNKFLICWEGNIGKIITWFW